MGTVTVLGGGSWGTALALQLARAGHSVRLWARDAIFTTELASCRENKVYLPGVPLPDTIEPTASLDEACAHSEMLVVVCPSKGVRALAEGLRNAVRGRPIVVSAAKGVEQGTHLTMSAILREVLGADHAPHVAVLSGPSFAREVSVGVPTAVTSAAADIRVAERVQQLFNGETFRVYTSTDVIGVENRRCGEERDRRGSRRERRTRLRLQQPRRAHHARARGDRSARAPARCGSPDVVRPVRLG
jgi:glycerol-3-phosphate dehydrogenase (NAD(P)+)